MPGLRHNFQASQAVHGQDDITALSFYSQVKFYELILLLTTASWSAQPDSANFGDYFVDPGKCI